MSPDTPYLDLDRSITAAVLDVTGGMVHELVVHVAVSLAGKTESSHRKNGNGAPCDCVVITLKGHCRNRYCLQLASHAALNTLVLHFSGEPAQFPETSIQNMLEYRSPT